MDSAGNARARKLLLDALGEEEVAIYDRTGGIRFRSSDDSCYFHVHKLFIGLYQLTSTGQSIRYKVYSYPMAGEYTRLRWCFEDRVLSFMLYDSAYGSTGLQQTGCAQPYSDQESKEVLERLVHTVSTPTPYG